MPTSVDEAKPDRPCAVPVTFPTTRAELCVCLVTEYRTYQDTQPQSVSSTFSIFLQRSPRFANASLAMNS